MKYDDASWHYGGEFPADLPDEAGATHIGMFVTWCMLNGLGGDIHDEEEGADILLLKRRELTPGTWFLKICDGKFIDEDLNDEGNLFANMYYQDEQADYVDDYVEILAEDVDDIYYVLDTWENYDKLAPKITERFNKWKSAER